jgi:alpha/beta superfamily hydrolase
LKRSFASPSKAFGVPLLSVIPILFMGEPWITAWCTAQPKQLPTRAMQLCDLIFEGQAGAQGLGEKEDAAAAIHWLENRYPALDLAVIGYSFGAWVGLEAGHSVPRIKALVGLGLPLNMYDFGFLLSNPKPALYIIGTNDEFCSLENLDRFADRLPSTSSVHRIEGSDHFFAGHLEAVQTLITGFLSSL